MGIPLEAWVCKQQMEAHCVIPSLESMENQTVYMVTPKRIALTISSFMKETRGGLTMHRKLKHRG